MEQTFEIQNKYFKYGMNIQQTNKYSKINKYSAYRIKTQSAPYKVPQCLMKTHF